MTFNTLISNINETHTQLQIKALQSVSVNLTIRNYLIGHYIIEYEQNGNDRAEYGARVLESMADNLKHIKGMSTTNLRLFRQFYGMYPQIHQSLPDQLKIAIKIHQSVTDESKINLKVQANKLLTHLTFTHFVELIKIDDDTKRVFYEVETIKANWSVRELKRQIETLLYERVGLSKDKNALLKSLDSKKDIYNPLDIIKNPYILEFTGLQEKASYSETDLENELLNHIEDFLLELGTGFCFEARQKRISIENEHDRVDLVFYHRILKCHVLVDLKVRAFSHADVGQMNFYLNYYKNEISSENDNPPIGIILCTDKNHTKVEYATAGLDENMFVSKYKIVLPSVNELCKLIDEEMQEITMETKND